MKVINKKSKKGVGVLFLLMSLIVFLLSVNLVFAQSYFAEDFLNRAWEGISPFFGALFGTSSFDELLFAKILVFFILFSIIFTVLKNNDLLGSNRGVTVIVTLSVSILAVRFMGDNEFIRGILLPYGVLGVAITVLLPLLIYFMFVQSSLSGSTLRRAAWILYGIIFLAMWGTRTGDTVVVNWIYIAGLIFVLANILFDGPIHEYMGSSGFRKARRNFHLEQKGLYAQKLEELEGRRHLYSHPEYEKLKRDLIKRYKQHVRKS